MGVLLGKGIVNCDIKNLHFSSVSYGLDNRVVEQLLPPLRLSLNMLNMQVCNNQCDPFVGVACEIHIHASFLPIVGVECVYQLTVVD